MGSLRRLVESLPIETEAMLWKFTALLIARGTYKSKIKKIGELARSWEVSERQMFRLLKEAEAIFKQLAGPLLMQPDLKDWTEEVEQSMTPKTD